MNYILMQFSYFSDSVPSTSQKTDIWLSKKGVKSFEIAQRSVFKKSQKMVISRPRSSARTKASTAVT